MDDKEGDNFMRTLAIIGTVGGLFGGLHFFSIGNTPMGFIGLGVAIFWAFGLLYKKK